MIDKNLREDGEKAAREVKLLLLGELPVTTLDTDHKRIMQQHERLENMTHTDISDKNL